MSPGYHRAVATRDELDEAVRAMPDDPAVHAVLADWLHERGEPEGELASLALRFDGSDGAVAARIAALQRQLDPFDDATRAGWSLDWRWGHIRRASLRTSVDAHEAKKLARLLASPQARFLRELRLFETSRRTDYLRLFELIATQAQTALRSLHTLIIHTRDPYAATPVSLDPIVRAVPWLERLDVNLIQRSSPLRMPVLRELAVRADDDGGWLRASELPALESLQVVAPSLHWVDGAYPALRRVALIQVRGRVFPTVHRDIVELVELEGEWLRDPNQIRTWYVERRRIAEPAPKPATALVVVGANGDLHPGTILEITPGGVALGGGALAGETACAPTWVRGSETAALIEAQQLLSRTMVELPYVNGYQVRQLALRCGDEIAIGHHVFVVAGDADDIARIVARRGLPARNAYNPQS
jgi:uncharacterized protein (TIGR02996 family)